MIEIALSHNLDVFMQNHPLRGSDGWLKRLIWNIKLELFVLRNAQLIDAYVDELKIRGSELL
jgi:hypothetical protein